MKMKLQVTSCCWQVPQPNGEPCLSATSNFQPSTCNLQRAFTLIELLAVLAILGIIAGLALPTLKNFGHADAMTAGTAQMIADVARARQLAISQRTTVYMVFLPTNFWDNTYYNNLATYNAWWGNLTPAQQTAVTNLCDRQLTGYTFIAYGAVGDQPGYHQWHYLAPWQALPDGTYIVTNKFKDPFQFSVVATPQTPVSSTFIPVYSPWNKAYPHSDNNSIYAFTNVAVPFPSEGAPLLSLPYIAFNYLGQLTLQSLTPRPLQQDEYIPLARGNVVASLDPVSRAFQLSSSLPQIFEEPPNNSVTAYNVIRVDWLTGRATLEQPKIQ